MLFLQIFYTFLLIGAFTFGGGYSMVALIQREVVGHHAWLTAGEFTDLLAVSQLTPGPIGINTATYTGYAAVVAAGYPQWLGVVGALLASLAVIAIPVALVLLAGGWLLRHKDTPRVGSVLAMVRLAAIGLIAAAALALLGELFGGAPSQAVGLLGISHTVLSALVFAAVFILSVWRRTSPVLLIAAAGVVGLLLF